MAGGKLKEKDPMRRLGTRYLKWTAYGLLILLACIVQAAPRMIPSIAGARPLLIIPMVVCIAMFVGPVGGGAAGVAGGLLWDMFADRLLGFNALLLLCIGCAAGLLVRLLIRNNLLSALLLCAAALLLQGMADWFFTYVLMAEREPLFVLIHQILPNMLYSLVVSAPLYGIALLTARILRNRE